MTKAEEKGLKSLQKRISEEEIVVLKTDKSSRFVVTTPENYLEMGREHTDKDEEVGWEEVKNMERKINSHTTAWELIWRTGEDHGHKERVLRTRVTRSCNQATLALLYKDHKLGNKTRPVASGNESFSLGLSNGLSDLMESVSRGMSNPYSVISSEDMLARMNRYNEGISKSTTTPPSSTTARRRGSV